MKPLVYYLVVIFFLTIFNNIFSQDNFPEGPDIDLIVQTENADGYQIKFELVPISTEYCWSSYCWNFSVASPVSNNTVVINGTSNCVWNGWDYRRCIDHTNTDYWTCSSGIGSTIQPLRNGFYRMNIYVNNVFKAHFYYDNRDADLPQGGCWNPVTQCCITCNLLRSSIKYNRSEDKLYFLNGFTENLGNPEWQDLPKEKILFLREIKNCNPANFSPFWNNGLVAVAQKNPASGVYEPFIVWGPHKDFNPTGYKIYWRLGTNGSFSLLATVGSNVYTFRHEGLAVGSGEVAQYRVQAFNNQGSSEFTNIASINTSGLFKGKSESNPDIVLDYQLLQNHPNPFNPTTSIGFQVKETGLVSLCVYDLLGREVKTLVNEVKTPGIHYVDWEADNNYGEKLPSGIYFYRMQAGTFVQLKKTYNTEVRIIANSPRNPILSGLRGLI